MSIPREILPSTEVSQTAAEHGRHEIYAKYRQLTNASQGCSSACKLYIKQICQSQLARNLVRKSQCVISARVQVIIGEENKGLGVWEL